jgi:hypothetical protein
VANDNQPVTADENEPQVQEPTAAPTEEPTAIVEQPAPEPANDNPLPTELPATRTE